MACLDTTFLIDLLRGRKDIKELKDELNKHESNLYVAAPSVMEIWTGANLNDYPEKEKFKIKYLLESFKVLNFDEKSAKEAGEIQAELIKKGKIIQVQDIMIAAISITNGEKIVTRDEDYIRVNGLKVLKY